MLIFVEGGKPENPEKNPRSKAKNQQQTQPTYDTGSRIWVRATLVGGERSHHCATPVFPFEDIDFLQSDVHTRTESVQCTQEVMKQKQSLLSNKMDSLCSDVEDVQQRVACVEDKLSSWEVHMKI